VGHFFYYTSHWEESGSRTENATNEIEAITNYTTSTAHMKKSKCHETIRTGESLF